MQLLQAKGWYGVFGRFEPTGGSELDDGTVPENFCFSVELRPLLGWCSVEGGFQPLFYDTATRRLITATKAEAEDGVFHLGDACVEEVTEIRAMLVLGIIRKAKALVKNRSSPVCTVELHPTAAVLVEQHKIPFMEAM